MSDFKVPGFGVDLNIASELMDLIGDPSRDLNSKQEMTRYNHPASLALLSPTGAKSFSDVQQYEVPYSSFDTSAQQFPMKNMLQITPSQPMNLVKEEPPGDYLESIPPTGNMFGEQVAKPEDFSDDRVVPSDSEDHFEFTRLGDLGTGAKRWKKKERELLESVVRHQCYKLQLQQAIALGQPSDRVPAPDQLPAEMLDEVLDEVDWDIVALNFAPDHPEDDCRAQWRLTHPRKGSEAPLGSGRGKWTKDEDRRLVEAIREFGDSHWKLVANYVGSRTAAQCLHRWKHSLKPSISRQKWNASEDERLMRAVQQHGRHWSLIAHVMGNRTGAQCRERFCNKLDPEIYRGAWTPDEDQRLREAVEQVGVGKWAQIAKMLYPPRTDYQIRKRWYIISRGEGSDSRGASASP